MRKVLSDFCGFWLGICKTDGRTGLRGDTQSEAAVNLRQLVKYVLWRDTTHHGEYRTFLKLMEAGLSEECYGEPSNGSLQA